MAMSPRLLRPLAQPKLLDFAPGAAAAYSLRQLSSSYAGPVVTVRRSSDSAEADFTAGEVSDGTLAAWVGSGNDGFVKTWHDQSGNNRDASQATSTLQPKIVSGGSLVTKGGKAAMEFDGTDDRLVITSYKPSNQLALFSVFAYSSLSAVSVPFSCHKTGSPSGGFSFFNFTPGPTKIAMQSGLGGTWVDGVNELAIGDFDLNATLISLQIRTSATTLHQNGAQLLNSNKGAIAAGNDFIIAGNAQSPGSNPFLGTHQELITYPSDQSANRQRIERDINRHYRIF